MLEGYIIWLIGQKLYRSVVLPPFKDYMQLLSSDLATLGLVIPMIQEAHKTMAIFLEPAAGYVDFVPEWYVLVRRLEDDFKVSPSRRSTFW